jgi:HPt (histidine-containing phosphotransfer) domain-containing protein
VPLDPSEFDPDRLAALLHGDADKIARFSRKYIDTAGPAVEQVVMAGDREDWAAVGRLAHSLKSSSATVGATALASACQELESACTRGDLTHARRVADSLPAMFARVHGALDPDVERP